jgi:hypothetical protein
VEKDGKRGCDPAGTMVPSADRRLVGFLLGTRESCNFTCGLRKLENRRQETRRLLAALTYHSAKMTGHKRSPMMLASHEPY